VILHQLRGELWKLFGKKRTYIGFAMFLITQNVISLVFKFTRASNPMQRLLEGNGYFAGQYISALTIAVIMVIPIAIFLLPLYVALIGGDLVAKEAEDGTLRMILSRPISRGRLLLLKWAAGGIFSVALVLALGVFGLIFARFWFPWNGLFVWMPEQKIFAVFEAGAGLARYAAAHGMLVTLAVTIMGLAFMFSCFNMKPAAATILALSFMFVNFILQHIPYFSDIQSWFFTYHLNLWQLMFAQPVPWPRVGESLCVLAGFNLTFLLVGLATFHVRDIKS
jgi:ABC-2 type transport system permease protein